MASLHRLPHNPGFLVIQADYRPLLSIVRNSLANLSVLINNQDTFHILYPRGNGIGIADIPHCLHPLGRHLLRLTEPLIQNPKRLRNVPLHQLFPGKYHHLFTVIQIQLSCLLLVSDQIRIEKGCLFIIQRIAMHEVQKDNLWQRSPKAVLINRHHIIFIELRNAKL